MATKSPNDATLQATRQMLDELDALMEKMLSLPVAEPEDAPAVALEEMKPPSLSPTLAATLTLLETPTRQPPATASSLHPTFNPPHLELPDSPSMPEEPAPALTPLTNDVEPERPSPTVSSLLAHMPDPEVPLTTRWIYLPLVWLNQAFDGVAAFLGAGAFLRSPMGRMLLGLSGITLTLAAVGWFLKDWLGWN